LKSCAFIGYQPTDFFFKTNELHPLCQEIKDALLEQARTQYQRGARRFCIGGGLGTDMWAGEAILSLIDNPEYPGIALACVMPFEGYNSAWDDDCFCQAKNQPGMIIEKPATAGSSLWYTEGGIRTSYAPI
jgi:uncharacterized phage-like protein YoqJ